MRLLRCLLMLSLASAVPTLAEAQPVRDHRDGPRDAPPPPRAETSAPKAGFVWVAGHWLWKANKYDWVPGHYEREQAGKQWRAGKWEKQGDYWVWAEGGWIAGGAQPPPPPPPGGAYPREAPPAPRAETGGTRPGFVWVVGRWDWKANKYEWVPGHFEREQAGKQWRAGHWDKDGDHWRYTDGEWQAGGPTPGGDYPREAPPPPRAETGGTRPGFVWVAGRWDWKTNKYEWVPGHFEREQAGKRWNAGHWDKDGDHWRYTDGAWADGAPVAQPPPPDRPRRDWRLERPTVGSYWPTKGKVGTRVVIRGKNFPSDATVNYAGVALRGARVKDDEIAFAIPTGASSGQIAIDAGRRHLDVGPFEVADYDAAAALKKQEEEARKAAEAAVAAREKALAAAAADRNARRAAIQKLIDDRIASREQRRADRIAEIRTKWDRAFLADPQTQDELTLHAQRVADLERLSEVAQLAGNTKAQVRVDVAKGREDARHDQRMTTLKAAFKGGRP